MPHKTFLKSSCCTWKTKMVPSHVQWQSKDVPWTETRMTTLSCSLQISVCRTVTIPHTIHSARLQTTAGRPLPTNTSQFLDASFLRKEVCCSRFSNLLDGLISGTPGFSVKVVDWESSFSSSPEWELQDSATATRVQKCQSKQTVNTPLFAQGPHIV